MTNKRYDEAKFVALVVLPGIATLYFAVAGIWHLPYAEQVVGTITAIDGFLGTVLHISTNNYNKVEAVKAEVQQQTSSDGDLLVSQVDGDLTLAFGVKKDTLDALTSKGTVTLNVVNLPTTSPTDEPPISSAPSPMP